MAGSNRILQYQHDDLKREILDLISWVDCICLRVSVQVGLLILKVGKVRSRGREGEGDEDVWRLRLGKALGLVAPVHIFSAALYLELAWFWRKCKDRGVDAPEYIANIGYGIFAMIRLRRK